MKRVLIVAALIVVAAVLGLWRTHGGVRQNFSRIVGVADNKSPGVTGDETRKSFELKPGSRIEITGIVGRVDVQTSDTKVTEVFVRRTTDTPESLRRRELTIEATSDGLLVRSRRNHFGLWEHLFGRDPKEEVTIKAPRQIALALRGIDGRVTSGDIDGALEVRGVNGRVELGDAGDTVEISSVNGDISLGLKQLSDRGMHIRAVNGGVKLRLGKDLNAELSARDMNGSVSSEAADINVERETGSRYFARIGKGGNAIDISAINGGVKLTRTDGTSAATVDEKKTIVRDRSAKSADSKTTKITQ